MTVKVKICGIKYLTEAEAAIKYGADFLGFNFVAISKRYIEPNTVLEILKKINRDPTSSRQESGLRGARRVKIAGVFSDKDTAREIAEFLKLDYMQIHSQNIIKNSREIRAAIVNVKNLNTEYFLVDREIQGQGKPVDLGRAFDIARKYPVFLAGGLNPENVKNAILKAEPFAVDVASGVEINGKKDRLQIEKFIKAVKGAI